MYNLRVIYRSNISKQRRHWSLRWIIMFFDLFPSFTGGAIGLCCSIWSSAFLVAMVLGAFMGPYGMGWVTDVVLIAQIATIELYSCYFCWAWICNLKHCCAYYVK